MWMLLSNLFEIDFAKNLEIEEKFKVGCIFPIVVSKLIRAEFGRNDHREDASHFKFFFIQPNTRL